jgi:AraC family transcriptional regulator of adaptative response / DNA-3-methyladenine glycosylase II
MRLGGADPRDVQDAVARCRALLDLDANPAAIDAVLTADPLLAPMVRLRPGRRVPGTVDRFELAVRAILGQQVTVAAACMLATRIVAGCGPRLPHPDGVLIRLFPGPDELLAADPSVFKMPVSRREAVLGLARAWPCPDRETLLAVPGVGAWTADYVEMRSGNRDVLPHNDAALCTALRRLPGTVGPDKWRPYRAHAMMHLWDPPVQGTGSGD